MSAGLQTKTPDYSIARFNMVESQVRPNKVRNPHLLERMSCVPRELFVPPHLVGTAYIDRDIQIGANRYLLEPMVLARFLEEANLSSKDHVLDVAPGTGYSTALISALAHDVVAIECDPNLIQQAVTNFDQLHIKNISLQLGPLASGWKATAPYDVIIVNGAIDHLPDSLSSQLAEGGRLLVAVRTFGPAHAAHKIEARLYEKRNGALSQRPLFDANVKLLPGFEAKEIFSF